MNSVVDSATRLLASWSEPVLLLALKSVVILALVFAVMAFLRRIAAAVRHWIWTTAFACLLTLPVVSFRFPVWSAPTWVIPFDVYAAPDSLELNSKGIITGEPAVVGSKKQIAPERLQSEEQKLLPNRQSRVAWSEIWIELWLIGVLVGCMRQLAAQVRLKRLARQAPRCKNKDWLELVEQMRTEYGIRRPVTLLISERFSAPVTWGAGSPVIALPLESALWERSRVELVLRHELAHVKRWDCLTQEMAHLACLLYWFNPLAWFAARRMRSEREKACDDFVLNAGARPSEYAGFLVEIAQNVSAAPQPGGAVAMARPSGLEQRVVAILDRSRSRNRIAKATVAAIVLAALGLELLVGGCARPGLAAEPNGATAEKAENGDTTAGLIELVKALGQADSVDKTTLMALMEGVKSLRKAADQGDAIAQFRLGLLYEARGDIKKYAAEAAKWYRKSADQGNARAQLHLGVMIEKGEGVGKDLAEAAKWLRKAALQGNQPAQFRLGVMYANGSGVEQNYVEAYAWLNLSATNWYEQWTVTINNTLAAEEHNQQIAEMRKQNQQKSATERDMLAKKMSSEQIAGAKKRSAQLKDRILGRIEIPMDSW